MPATKEIGPFFLHVLRYPSTDFPLVERGTTQEIDHPFRKATSLVFRVPFRTRAFVVGKWGPPADDPDEALHQALRLFQEVNDVPEEAQGT